LLKFNHDSPQQPVRLRALREGIGKGGGYSDLEYGLGREARVVRNTTPIVTTVHDLQVIDGEMPVLPQLRQ
jgi:5-formyltetrahydrofolate cyclo-ligase